MKQTFKYLIFILAIASQLSFAENPPDSKVSGYFLAFGVGPRFPLGDFSKTTSLGYGANVEFSYADTDFLPVFLFANIGFEQYPASQNYLDNSELSNFHTNAVPVNLGARYYFSPLMENIVLLMPIVQVSANYTYLNELYEFKNGTGKADYSDNKSKFGFSAGAGVSMFMMELLASYNYTQTHQFISLDLKVRIPLYINF
jgi:opacity protein-like surface antigen